MKTAHINSDVSKQNQQARQDFQTYARDGILRHAISKTDGGHGNTFIQLCHAYEKLGFETVNTGLILSLQAHVWGALFPLINFGSRAQKNTFLASLLGGEIIGGHAITEPSTGSDISAMQTTYIEVEGGYLLNGHKRFITNTPIADLLIVYARNQNVISAFLIQNQTLSARFLNEVRVEGFATAPMGDVVLENCFVPEELRIGPLGAGKAMIQSILELERAFLFSGILGIMRWQLDKVSQHCRTRMINGAILGNKQAISHKIAEMAIRLNTTKLWIEYCARLKDENKRITIASSQTKLFASEAFLNSSLDAVQILGAFGLVKEHKMSQLVQDAMAGKLLSGSNEIQKNIISSLLGVSN